jgi:hypothetical protein
MKENPVSRNGNPARQTVSTMTGGRPWATKCQTCRKRKVKVGQKIYSKTQSLLLSADYLQCGGELPNCQRCLKAGFICGGYAKTIQFKHSTFQLSEGLVSLPRTSSGELPLSEGRNIRTILRWDQRRRGITFDSRLYITQWAKLPLSSPPGFISAQDKVRMLDALHQMFLPTLAGPPVCASWINDGCAQARAEPDGPLCHALLALSMRKVGYSTGDWNWAVQSFTVYQEALNGLRRMLRCHPHDCNWGSFLLASFASVIFEVSL